jgi:aerobic-type carbon monoxide dehydrogenase small subunit (CoxS/CutS family)
MTIHFTLNGAQVETECDAMTPLLYLLRDNFGLTGTKEGCGEGECGACSVLLNGRVVNSCITPAAAVSGSSVETIEGIAASESGRRIADAFARAGAVQCGFCTPGFVVAIEALLRADRPVSPAEIRHALSGNLCRCTGYEMIFEAVEDLVGTERENG